MKTLASAVVTESSLYSAEQVPRQNQVSHRLCGRPYSGAFMCYLSRHDAHAQKSPCPMGEDAEAKGSCRRYSGTCSRQARQLGLNREDLNSTALAVSIRKYQLPITAMMRDDDKGCSTIRAYSLSLGVHLESPATFLGSFIRPAVG